MIFSEIPKRRIYPISLGMVEISSLWPLPSPE